MSEQVDRDNTTRPATQVTYCLDREDVWQFNRYQMFHLPSGHFIRLKAYVWCTLIGVIYGFLFHLWFRPGLVWVAVSMIAITGLVLAGSLWFVKRKVMTLPSAKLGGLGEHVVSIGPSGFRELNPDGDSTVQWANTKDIIEDKEHLYLMLDTRRGSVIPKRAFRSQPEVQAFLSTATAYWKSARSANGS